MIPPVLLSTGNVFCQLVPIYLNYILNVHVHMETPGFAPNQQHSLYVHEHPRAILFEQKLQMATEEDNSHNKPIFCLGLKHVKNIFYKKDV